MTDQILRAALLKLKGKGSVPASQFTPAQRNALDRFARHLDGIATDYLQKECCIALPSFAALPLHNRSSAQSTRQMSTARGTPCAPPASDTPRNHALRGNTSGKISCSSWLHLLKSRSPLKARDDSVSIVRSAVRKSVIVAGGNRRLQRSRVGRRL